ncbi:Uncharacterised protein [Bordetella pertussis]|nr:Uncharacterised protein [Bordetella pertussis]
MPRCFVPPAARRRPTACSIPFRTAWRPSRAASSRSWIRPACSTPGVWCRNSRTCKYWKIPWRHANKSCFLGTRYRFRRGGRCHPAPLRALRFLYRYVSDLPGTGRRAGQSARPHLPDQAAARRQRADPGHPAAPGPLPDLPQLRNDLSIGGGVWAAGRYRPPTGPRARTAPAGRQAAPRSAAQRHEFGLVRPGHAAGPDGARHAAAGVAAQGAGGAAARPVARSVAP